MRNSAVLAIVVSTLSSFACGKPDAVPLATTSATPIPADDGTAKPSDARPGAADKAALGVTKGARVGQPAPDFDLVGLDGAKASLADHKGKIVVLEWFNPDCPYVKAAHTIGSLKGMAKAMKEKYGGELVWLAINSGADGRQGHGDDTNRAGKERFGFDYPVLYDATGDVGAAYGATNTPHMYVIDKQGTLVYAGALDNTGSGDPEDAEPELINFVGNALEDLAAGKPIRKSGSRAWGCSVKYAKD